MPVYNGESYLAAAIGSVLAQRYSPIEIIVVDDGSTDASGRIAQSFGAAVRYEPQLHVGSPDASRNLGIRSADGDYLAFLDQDDLWVCNKLTLQMDAFAADESLDMAFGHVEQFISPDFSGEAGVFWRFPTGIKPGRILSSMMIRQGAFHRVGWFLTQWQLSGFVDWYARARELELREVMLSQVIARRRIHGTNLNIARRKAQIDYVRAIKACLDRRRKAKTL